MGISEKVCAAEVERSTLHQGDELRQIHVPPNDLIVCGREKDRMFLVHVATVLAPTLNDWAMTQNPAQPEAPFVNYFKSGWHAETRGVRDPLLDASDKPPDAAASGFDVRTRQKQPAPAARAAATSGSSESRPSRGLAVKASAPSPATVP